MNNYKIRVNNEAESREAQELFEQLGFKWAGDYPVDGGWYSHLYAENSNCCYLSPYVWGGLGDRFKELTLPQLRDLVAQGKSKEQGLISGADALRALADGKEVEFENGFQNTWVDINSLTIDEIKGGYFIDSDEKEKIQTKFRIKPVKLEIEVPAPFEPKDGNECFILSSDSEDGFYRFVYEENSGFHKNLIQFGVWRTEAEIKIVVEQLRKLKEHSK